MTRITNQERIANYLAECKVMKVLSLKSRIDSNVTYNIVDIVHETTSQTIVTDCPDWRKSARDERGEPVV